MLDHPVTFVIGVTHSGTTILYRLLARHPRLAWFSQFSQRSGSVPGRRSLPFWGLYNRAMRRLFPIPWRKKRDWTEYVLPRPMEANRIWDYLLPSRYEGLSVRPHFYRPSEITPRMVRRFDHVLRSELNAWNRNRLITKLPRLTRAVRLLGELLPRARFVHVVRDGRAVALSNRHKFSSSEADPRNALRQSARHWKALITHVLDEAVPEVGEGRFHTIHLEHFQTATRERLEGILRFLDLPVRDYPGPPPTLRPDTNRKWRERATDGEVRLLREELDDSLERLGYTEQTTWRPRENRRGISGR